MRSRQRLRASFIFPVLGPAERKRFIASARPQSFRAGEPIFLMGAPGTSMMLVETGEVTISYPSPDGRAVAAERTQARRGVRRDRADRRRRALGRRDREHQLHASRLRAARFHGAAPGNWPLAEAVLKLVCARLRRSDERMADLAFFDLPRRLAKLALTRPARPAAGRRASATRRAPSPRLPAAAARTSTATSASGRRRGSSPSPRAASPSSTARALPAPLTSTCAEQSAGAINRHHRTRQQANLP